MKRPKKVKKLYHCTFPTRLESILAEGLDNTRNWEQLVYLSTKPENAVQFIALRAVEIVPDEYVEVDGEKVPKLLHHDKLVVIEIDATGLDWNRMDYGYDHSPEFFGPDPVYTYKGRIHPIHFDRVLECHLKKPEESET